MTRTFIAVERNDAVTLTLERQIAVLAIALPGVRWVDPAALHLTLAFLGELDEAQVAAAIEAADAAACRAQPFRLEVAGLGTFGPPKAPRVIWAGLGGDLTALRALHADLARELQARGFPPEERAFSPHLTLARIKQPLRPDAVSRLSLLMSEPVDSGASMRVGALDVLKSELRGDGAVYTRLRACPFGEGGSSSLQ
jgi:RNA 2',3'-cyclic 3'-phosphodiesterase